MIQGIAKAVSEAVIQSLAPVMMSNQSDSAPALTKTPVQDAPVNTSPIGAIGVDATVQGPVTSVIHTLSGEPLTGVALVQSNDRPGDIFCSMSLPIDARVTTTLKAKIWANEFLNIGQLITVTPMEEKFNISVNTSKDSLVSLHCVSSHFRRAKTLVLLTPGLLLSRYLLEYILLNFRQKL